MNRDLVKIKAKINGRSLLNRKSEKPLSNLYLYFEDCYLELKDKFEIFGVAFDSKLLWTGLIIFLPHGILKLKAGQSLGALRKVANMLDS